MSDHGNEDPIDKSIVEQLEEELKADHSNIDIQEELASALVDRYHYEGGAAQDFKWIKRLLTKMPKDRGLYARGYTAWFDHQDSNAVKNLYKCAVQMSESIGESFTNDELYNWIAPFLADPPKHLWRRLAEGFSHGWVDSAVVLTLRGMSEDNPGGAVDYLVQALEKDETFWLAAYWCALVYHEQKNWRAARGYYLRTLKYESAASLPEPHFDLAQCYWKTKEYEAQTNAYRACLKRDPDFPLARNNMGLALMRLGKYEEAAAEFREAIQRGNDGKYPLRNLAEALKRLGRFAESIEVLRRDMHRGAITRTSQKQITTLEALIRKQAEGEALPVDMISDEGEDEDDHVAALAVSIGSDTTGEEEENEPDSALPEEDSRAQGVLAHRLPLRTSHPIQTEQTFEALLEEMILREGKAFGRRLRMFESLEGLYGRQLAIPGIGRIDLLVEDLDTQELLVIELKRGKSTDEVVGQLCRYLGWVQANLAKNDQKVRGIICVHRSLEKLRLAVSAVSGVEIFEYTLNFQRV